MATRKKKEPSGKPANGQGTKDYVLQTLRERIATHELSPGSRLNEHQLAEEFGVSRTQIRDVFARLEQRGLIQRSPNKSAVVMQFDLTQVFDLFAVREVLEGLGARLAAQNAPPESWQDLVELFGEPMSRLLKAGELEEYMGNLELLRKRIIDAAKNPMLTEMLDSIYDKIRELGRRIIILPGRAEQGLKEHRALLVVLRRGNAEESERLRRENIRSSCDYLRRYQRFIL